MKSDKQLKKEATVKEMSSVFDHFNSPKDIQLHLKDGIWERRLIKNLNTFWWSKWRKV